MPPPAYVQRVKTRLAGLTRPVCWLALALALLPVGTAATAGTLAGAARVVDGDTLVVDGVRVRLLGIDAPELHQTCWVHGRKWACGKAARDALRDLVRGQSVMCDVRGRDRWRRALAVCFVRGVDIARELVRLGWALAWVPRGGVPGPDYTAEQARAQVHRRGIWHSRVVRPWLWRRGRQ